MSNVPHLDISFVDVSVLLEGGPVLVHEPVVVSQQVGALRLDVVLVHGRRLLGEARVHVVGEAEESHVRQAG